MPSVADIKNLKLSPSDDGTKKDRMEKLCDSLKNQNNVFTRLVGSNVKPGLYPENLKKSIQEGGPAAAMSDATEATIMQEYSTYIAGIEDAIKKIREETLQLVSEIFSIDESIDDHKLIDGLTNQFNESSRQYSQIGINCIDAMSSDISPLKPPDPVPLPTMPPPGPVAAPEH